MKLVQIIAILAAKVSAQDNHGVDLAKFEAAVAEMGTKTDGNAFLIKMFLGYII